MSGNYNTLSGNMCVTYNPLLGEVKIMNTGTRKRYGSWDQEAPSLLLSPQDAIEIGIYLLGLQPHIRDVLARKDTIQDVPSVEYPTPDMVDQDL
jgi:hypothetical protein